MRRAFALIVFAYISLFPLSPTLAQENSSSTSGINAGAALAGTYQGNAWATSPSDPTLTNNIYVAQATVTQTNSTGNFAVTDSWTVSVHAAKLAADGEDGDDGKTTKQGIVYYQLGAASAPSTPSATSYTISTNTFSGLTANWDTSPPTTNPTDNTHQTRTAI